MQTDASFTFEPGVIALVSILAVAYAKRFREARRSDGARGAPAWRAWSFAAGLFCLLVALVSPVDRLGEQLFAMHMVQHVLLLDLAPVLLVLGLTRVILRPVTRRLEPLERAAGPLGHPVFAVAAYVALMWLWHVPALYDAANEHVVVHVLEHMAFASVGLLYWWHLLGPVPSRHLGRAAMAPVVYMLSTKLLVGLLGVGLTFSPDPLYAFYEQQGGHWGLTPGEDQSLAGLIMAVEQSIVMGIALAFLFTRMLGESDRQDERDERFADV